MSLKRELERPDSEIRTFIAERLPETASPRAEYRSAMADAVTTIPRGSLADGPLPDRVPWDVLGQAISARLLWELDSAPAGRIAGRPAEDLALFGHAPCVVDELRAAIDSGPAAVEADIAARVAWIGGLLDRGLRAGRGPDVWFDALRAAESWDAILACVPSWYAADISAVTARCATALLELAGGAVFIAPTFAGSSALGGAEADVIAGGALIDVKATKDLNLRLRDLHQIVGYALLDWDDQYGITAVGILAARQGRLITWPLSDLLAAMAGHPMTVSALRDELQTRMGCALLLMSPAERIRALLEMGTEGDTATRPVGGKARGPRR